MDIGSFGGEDRLEKLAKNIIEQYYNMSNEQRNFILNVIELNPNWNKYDFMKALLLFNKMNESGCRISDDEMDIFINEIDKHNIDLNYWLRKYDGELWKKLGLA